MDKPKPRKVGRIGPLVTAIDCRRELAKCYREFRKGQIDANSAKTSCYLLQNLVGIIKESVLTEQVRLVEARVDELTEEDNEAAGTVESTWSPAHDLDGARREPGNGAAKVQ